MSRKMKISGNSKKEENNDNLNEVINIEKIKEDSSNKNIFGDENESKLSKIHNKNGNLNLEKDSGKNDLIPLR